MRANLNRGRKAGRVAALCIEHALTGMPSSQHLHALAQELAISTRLVLGAAVCMKGLKWCGGKASCNTNENKEKKFKKKMHITSLNLIT